MDAIKEAVTLWEACTGTGSWQEGSHTGSVCEELQSVRRTQTGEFHGGLSAVGATPSWSRGKTPSPEEETALETTCEHQKQLTLIFIPRLSLPLAGKR